MAIWSGIGMNYSRNINNGLYSAVEVEADLTFLKSAGIARLRVVLPTYTSTTAIANCQDIVTRALNHGFYVLWGVSVPATETAADWASFRAYVTGTLASWAQSNGLSELSLGNEIELHVDGTTLIASTIRSDLRSMATTVKSGGYTGKVSYQTSIADTYRTPWISEGIGSLDLIGWNSYDVLSNFTVRTPIVLSAFMNKTYISEFGCVNNGYPDYSDEMAWYNDVLARIQSLRNTSIQSGYFYCYRDDNTDTFALQLSNGATRLALKAVLGDLSPVNHGLYGHP